MASHEVDEIIDAEVPFSVVSLHATQARIVPDGFHNYFMRTALQSRGMVLLSRLQYCCNCIIIAIMRHTYAETKLDAALPGRDGAV